MYDNNETEIHVHTKNHSITDFKHEIIRKEAQSLVISVIKKQRIL